ncbi:MAG: aldo/keto reductase [Lachnospiraceae bacterium]|nr:aldo/keto reductase [Lachnospiraceae bacterium]
MEYMTLDNGVTMPQEGYGVFQIPPDECERCVTDALSVGYRLIDTASAYGNEEGVGAAVRKSGIPREELFITTKLWVQDTSYEGAKRAAEASMKRLGLDYLDLYLIHQPFGDYYGAWHAMEEMYREGTIRAIGVCNFDEARLVDLCVNHEIQPAVNQVEIHPFHQQTSAIQTMRRYQVQPEAWGPLSEGQKNIFCHRLLSKIAARYQKSTAQIILRWNIQRGVVVIPKSARKERMEENINIWDFTLDSKDMDAIAALDIGHSEIINHYSSSTARALNAMKIHP